ncbi:MamI family restriction endonuclease [Fusobacterium pseudoperiodonticum]|uniref:MamI family restriction endonuclease n=1 Tax=Fusobacterium pseudoperiodonticum TaxID=2663009 RepID=UPI0028F0D9AD|nr:MamI family restriction endonuclease [Fusobacterium pseudoperiodonticum]
MINNMNSLAERKRLSEKLIYDLYIDLRKKIFEWSALSNQTPQARMGYVGQHLVSIVTGFGGSKSGARGYDIIFSSCLYGEIKTCYRVDQLGRCKNCGLEVSAIEKICPHCNSENIERKEDSKWLLPIKNNNDLKNMIEPFMYFFVLFEFEDITDLYNENIIASIWTVNPKNMGFYLCILDYYQNILTKSDSKAPFNLWPYMLKFQLMQPKLIYRSIISESEVTTTIFEDYLGGNVETLYPFVRFHKANNLTQNILKNVIQKLCHKYNLYVKGNIDSYNKKKLCEIIDEIILKYNVPNNTLCDILSESLYFENIDLEEVPDNYKILLKERGLY